VAVRRFVEKVVLVTGAAGVLGNAIAARMASEGAVVVLADLPGADTAALVEGIRSAGGTAHALELDVSSADSVAGGFVEAVSRFGGLDVLVNNAGIEGGFASTTAYDDDVFDRVFAVNVRGVYLGMKHAVPHLRSRGGGAIVNLSSVAGLQGTPGMIAYGMSKHAVIGMTKSVAAEEAAAGIRVTAVCPAPVEGRMMRSIERGVSGTDDGESVRADYQNVIPAHRYAEPNEIANLVCFLASDEARYITGSWHRIDGGMGVMSA
jgi:NAD(P)-dependent dehydrogenase (short-subunit alcohol dehydrogenase family)